MAKRKKTGGRKPGSANKANALIRERIESEADPIGFLTRIMNGERTECLPPTEKNRATDKGALVALYPTLDQRMSAANKLADKLIATPRSRAVQMPLPDAMASPEQISAAADSIMREMARGRLTLDEADTAMSVLAKRRQIYESEELERRIEALEGSLRGSRDAG